MKFGIGQPITRLEDRKLLTGDGRFADDAAVEGMAYGHVLRSPHAHADILALDTSAAAAMDGVLAILTHAEAAADDIGDMPCLVEVESRDGSSHITPPRPVLANGRVRHVGDPVAFVVAETLSQARDAAEAIAVDYAALPAVVETREAARDGAPQVWSQAANNLCFDWESGDKAAVDAAFRSAAHVSSLELVNNRVIACPMEPRAALAQFDSDSGRLTLTAPSQGVHILHGQLAEQVLKIDKAQLRVLSGDVGGGFGTRAFLYPECCLVLWAARRLRRAVKWTGERGEIFMTDAQARDNVSHAELALDDGGHFLAIRVTTYAGLGAYLSNFGPFVPTQAGTHMLTGLYDIPAMYVNVKGVFSNTVPTDAYRGAGRPEAAYLIERMVDLAGRELGIGQDEIRRRNFIAPDAIPYTTASGNVYDSGEFTALMETCMQRADWAGFGERRKRSARQGKLRGIGMASYVERCGGGVPETASVEFNDDDTISIVIGNQQNGQGHVTTYTQILCDRLEIEPERVRIIQGDSDRVAFGMTGGSRGAPVGGAAVLGAADQVIKKGRVIAAQLLEAAVVDVEFGDGEFVVAGTDRRLSLFQVAQAALQPGNLPAGLEPGLDETHTRVPEAATFPNGCHVCELELDPDTGAVEILRYTVVDDFGDVINPLMLAGQVHGGIAQGVGQALCEHTVYEDGSGQLLSASYMDYAVPRADLLPQIEFSTRNIRCGTNPLGIKGAGEAGTIGAMPAVINALVDALEPTTGARHVDMPATPLSLWRLLDGARAST